MVGGKNTNRVKERVDNRMGGQKIEPNSILVDRTCLGLRGLSAEQKIFWCFLEVVHLFCVHV